MSNGPSPTTISDSLRAFTDHSRFDVWPLNAYYGYPLSLNGARPKVIVLHYTLFYEGFRPLGPRFVQFLDRQRDSYLIAMFQDEQAFLDERVTFCRDYDVDSIYTMFGPQQAEEVYGGLGGGRVQTTSHIPGYVSEELRELGARFSLPDAQRPIDVGYRGRKPPAAWGPAGLEKYEIAVRFEPRARHSHPNLRLDIETSEEKRIYGHDWYRFIAGCRATLGTESGTEIPREDGPTLPYRTISPRHFEAAALGSCQVLYEGHYSGLLEPMRHYIPLRKDLTNFDETMERYLDPDLRARLVANAKRDLIDDDRATYRRFIEEFDQRLVEAGITPGASPLPRARMAAVVYSPRPRRRFRIWLSKLKMALLR